MKIEEYFTVNLGNGSFTVSSLNQQLFIIPRETLLRIFKNVNFENEEIMESIKLWGDIISKKIIDDLGKEPYNIASDTFLQVLDSTLSIWGLGRCSFEVWGDLLWLKWTNIEKDEKIIKIGENLFSAIFSNIFSMDIKCCFAQIENDDIKFWILNPKAKEKVELLKKQNLTVLEIAYSLLGIKMPAIGSNIQ